MMGKKLRYLWRNRKGYCPVCSGRTLFLLTDRDELIRNHAVCIRCRSASRHRHLALCILEAFADMGIRKLSDFRSRPDLDVYNASANGPIPKALGGGNVVLAEYFDDVAAGSLKDGIQCQNLEALTFKDGRFDLVISEDVFEHLKDYRRGFAEVFRVLKPGGYHIFTIPFYFDRRTRELFDLVDGAPVLRQPIEYHGDPLRGNIPCYTHFGYDLLDFLREAGYQAKVRLSSYKEENHFGTFDCYTVVTRKNGSPYA